MSFTHLHVHTEYSLLDGMTSLDELIYKCKEFNMDSVAITDHGNIFGALDFYKKAKKAGIHPVIGSEVYTAQRTRHDKENRELDGNHGHLVLLAENNEGYHSLCKIISNSYTDGFYYKPRVDIELLKENAKGLIALSACIQGDVPKALLNGDYDKAKKLAENYIEIFGENNFFLEIQNQDLDEEARIKSSLIKLSKEIDIPLVATNDIHYADKSDFEAHDALLCIQTGKKIIDDDRMRFPNDEFYFKSEDEMKELFYDIPESIDITSDIAKRCNISFDNIDNENVPEKKKYHLPKFTKTEGKTPTEFLRYLCENGLEKRYGKDKDEHFDRLNRELLVIEKTGFVDYFLITWDFVNYAKNNDISVGPGRGSAAGSIIAYTLEITDIDPIKFGLIFERFLNAERISMPDIDIDFEDREKMVAYVTEEYGKDKVSQIITFGKLKTKAVLKDVARVLDFDFNESNALTKPFPTVEKFTLTDSFDFLIQEDPEKLDSTFASTLNKNKAIIEAIGGGKYESKIMHIISDTESDDYRIAESTLAGARNIIEQMETNPRAKKLLRIALRLEGRSRNAGTHAAGVVITNKPITDYLPLYKNKDVISTEFTMNEIEELGLLKMDFLGLKNLTVIKDTINMIKKKHNKEISFENTDYADKKAYKIIQEGNTEGIFQLESPGMTSFMKDLKPTSIEDLTAGVALYRPGPMDFIPMYVDGKHNAKTIKYDHELLEPILNVTYGCIVYQEQVMQIVRDLAGYTYAQSDVIRKAMGKKKHSILQKEKSKFIYGNINENIKGCVNNGVPEDIAISLWEKLEKFGSYAFNKSHSASYAVIAYITAFLKANYPQEFMASLMSSAMRDTAKIKRYIKNANSMNIEVLPPSVLESEYVFTVVPEGIRFALGGLKGVGESAVNDLLDKRTKYRAGEIKKPETFQEFIETLDHSKVNKGVIESFVSSGATEVFPGNRMQHWAVYPQIIEQIKNDEKEKSKVASGQSTLFDMNSEFSNISHRTFPFPEVSAGDKEFLLSKEQEVSGVYLSGHPIKDFNNIIEKIKNIDDTWWDWKNKKQRKVRFVFAKDVETNSNTNDETSELQNSNINQEGLAESPEFYDGDPVRVTIYLTDIRTIMTKKGDSMAILKGEDETGEFEIIIFPKLYQKAYTVLELNKIFVVMGTLDFKDTKVSKILANKITEISEVEKYLTRGN